MFRSKTLLRCTLFLALAKPLPAADLTAEEIVRSAIEGEKRQESLRQQYIYREHQENRLLKPDGTPGRLYINRDFEHIFLEGGFYRKLVAIGSKPLKPKQAREEEEKMRMTAAERKAAGSNEKGIHTLTSGVPLVDIVAMMDHKILREEEFGGLTCWVVQSEPKPNAVPQTPNQTRAMAYRYVQWIAQTDRSIPRKEWEVIGEGQDTPPGSNVKLVFLRNPDGALLPQQYTWNSVRYKGKGVAFLQIQVFSDYRRFTSQTSVQFDDAPR
jgi:hypothetical protein